MKKRYIIGFMLVAIFLLYGCASEPNKIKLDESQKNIEYSKVEDLNYWIIGKDLEHNFSQEESTESLEEENLSNIKEESEESRESRIATNLAISNGIAEKKNLTEEQKNDILKQIDSYNISDKNGITYTEFIYLIDENIASFNQRERDLIVKKYITSFYTVMNELNAVLEVIGYDLEEAVQEYEINVNDKKSIAELPDSYGTVRGFLLEVKEKGFFVNHNGNNEGFYIDLDLGNMLDKYRDYISPSLIAYMEFNNYEMSNILVDYDIEEIAKRIKMLEDGMAKDKANHYVMADRYASSITYYYGLLLGLSHNHFVDKNGTFKQSVLDEYANIKGSLVLVDILNKTTLAIQTNEMLYDDKVKGLVSDYINSKIYTNELNGILENENTYKYQIMTEEQLKPVEIKEEVSEETEEIETTVPSEENNSSATNKPETQNVNNNVQNVEPNNQVEITETIME